MTAQEFLKNNKVPIEVLYDTPNYGKDVQIRFADLCQAMEDYAQHKIDRLIDETIDDVDAQQNIEQI